MFLFNNSSICGVSCDLMTEASSPLLVRWFLSYGVLFLVCSFVCVCALVFATSRSESSISAGDSKLKMKAEESE